MAKDIWNPYNFVLTIGMEIIVIYSVMITVFYILSKIDRNKADIDKEGAEIEWNARLKVVEEKLEDLLNQSFIKLVQGNPI